MWGTSFRLPIRGVHPRCPRRLIIVLLGRVIFFYSFETCNIFDFRVNRCLLQYVALGRLLKDMTRPIIVGGVPSFRRSLAYPTLLTLSGSNLCFPRGVPRDPSQKSSVRPSLPRFSSTLPHPSNMILCDRPLRRSAPLVVRLCNTFVVV